MFTLFFCALLGLAACSGPASLQACSDPTTAGCAADRSKMTLITTCNGYANTLMSLAAMRSKLGPTEDQTVDASVAIVQPLCHTTGASNPNALATVQAELAKLQAAQAAAAAGSK
jgi:hypothetical protein